MTTTTSTAATLLPRRPEIRATMTASRACAHVHIGPPSEGPAAASENFSQGAV